MRHQGSSQIRRWAVRGTVATVAATTAAHAAHSLSGEGGNNMPTEAGAAFGGSTTSTNPLDLFHKATGLTPIEAVALLIVLGVVLFGSTFIRPASKATPGFATTADLRRTMSLKAARKQARQTRPSMSKQDLRRAHWNEYAVRMGRSAHHRGRSVYGTLQDNILITGPSGSYKSVYLAGLTMDAPGAVVFTTTKVGDVEASLAVRATRARPVWVFNPYGLGGGDVPNTFRWSPVLGCRDEQVAISRAAYMLYGSRSGARSGDSLNSFFKDTACDVLRAYLMAADLAGLDMRDVYRWVTDADDGEAVKLLKHYKARTDWIEVLEQRQRTTERTRDGIYTTLSTALSWMANPAIADAVCPEEPLDSFEVLDFIRRRGTLYLLAEDRVEGSVSPLLTMFMGHLVEEGKAYASGRPGRRIDPTLVLILDEVANICPVPLPVFFSELRAHGFLTTAAIQSRSQLRKMWGADDAEVIWNNAAWTLILAGIKNVDDLRAISDMIGPYRRRKPRKTQGANGRMITTGYDEISEPIMTPADVRSLGRRPRRMLAIHRDSPPALVTIPKTWRRADVRKAGKAAAKANKELRQVDADV